MHSASVYWITITELPSYQAAASRVFTTEEATTLTDFLAMYPLAGDVIPDTGGVRVIRWPAASQGRRSGARVVYFFHDLNTPVQMLAIFEKGERMNLSARDKLEMRYAVRQLIEAYGSRRAGSAVSVGAA